VTFPDVHLADEAVAAYVDDGLSPAARHRAERHVRLCLECRAVVEAQQEAKVLLAGAPDPDLPAGLLSRLRDIPMTADLGGSDVVVVLDAHGLAWTSASAVALSPGGEPRLMAAAEPAGPVEPPAEPAEQAEAVAAAGAAGSAPVGPAGSPGDAAPAAGSGRRPGRGSPDHRRARPRPYPAGRSVRPMHRGRRRLAGALAGLAFGVIASAASTTAPNTAAPAGQIGTGGIPVPAVDRGGSSSSTTTTLELNTLRVGPERRQSDLLPVSRRGR
jgi:hypothetical protein